MYETLIIDGIDVATIVSCVQSIDGLYNVGASRGDNIVFPGVDGETWVDKPFATGTVDLGVVLAGTNTTQFNDSYRALKKLVKPGRRVSLERRMSFSTGNESHYAIGEYAAGLAPTISVARFGKTTLSMKLLDGVWYSGATTQLSFPAGTYVPHVEGDTRTHRIMLTMPPWSFIYNATTGHRLDIGPHPGGNVTVDVVNMTATQDGNDVSFLLSWNQTYPLQLVAGDNQLTTNGGFTLSYYQAFN